MLTRDMVFTKDAIVYFNTYWRDDITKMPVLVEKLKQIPEIETDQKQVDANFIPLWVEIAGWQFAYRIDISWRIGMVAIVLALITVSYQAIKAAITNPVKSLRCE